MHATKLVSIVSTVMLGLSIGGLSGCNSDWNLNLTLNGAAARLEHAVPNVQDQDPRDVQLPAEFADQGDTVVLDQDVTVIVDIQQDLVVSDLPDQTILGFDNQTGFDMYVKYYANDELQGIYVYDGETLLLDYPCLDSVELVSEDDIDPATGELVSSFDLANGLYTNPNDFACGDALIITFDPEAIQAAVELLDLVE